MMMMNRHAAKRALDLQRSAGIHDHPLHDQMLCNYADAAANDILKEIMVRLLYLCETHGARTLRG